MALATSVVLPLTTVTARDSGEPEVAAALLNEKAGWLHSQLFKLLQIHTVPTLRFFHDPKIVEGIEMSLLIDRANRPGSRADDPDEPEDPSK